MLTNIQTDMIEYVTSFSNARVDPKNYMDVISGLRFNIEFPAK